MVINSLYFGLVHRHTGFLGLLGNALTEHLYHLRIVVAAHDLAVRRKQLILLAEGTHILITAFALGLFSQNDFPITDVDGLDDLIIACHTP